MFVRTNVYCFVGIPPITPQCLRMCIIECVFAVAAVVDLYISILICILLLALLFFARCTHKKVKKLIGFNNTAQGY